MTGSFVPEYDYPSFEVINFLKSKLNSKIMEYEEEIKRKDETIKILNEKIQSLTETIEEIKKSYSEKEEELLAQNKELFLKMEESKQILISQKEKHKKEISLLKEIFERTKLEVNSLSEEISSLRKEREKLKKELVEFQSQKQMVEDKLKMLEAQLSQSKKAVEDTLTELLSERKKTGELNKKIVELEKMNKDLEKQIESIRVAWDSERAQWKEMWERERSMWESHRMEFAVWEERLRSEREAWLKAIKEEEMKGVEGAKALYKVLEDASKWSYKVSELLKLYANKGVELPHILTSTDVIQKKTKEGLKKIFIFVFGGILMFSGIFYFAYDYKQKLRFSKVFSLTLEDNTYTSFVKRDNEFVFASLNNGIVFKDQKLNNIRKFTDFDGIRPKITAISQDGYDLWLLDLSGLRFIKIDPDTGRVLKTVKSIGFAPQGLYSDGMYLWSFDAVTGFLYRYEINGDLKGVSSYKLDGIKNVDSIVWAGDILYVVSNEKIYRFKYTGNKFKKISQQNAKNFVYCYVYKDELYSMKDINGVKEFEIFKIKNKE